MQLPVGVVHSLIEYTTANKSCQVGDSYTIISALTNMLHYFWKLGPFEIVTNFQRVPIVGPFRPCSGKLLAAITHRGFARSVVKLTRPGPGSTKWRLAPPRCDASVATSQCNANSGTGDTLENLCTELERRASFNRKKIQNCSNDTSVGWEAS